ncbi:MAG TPA: magnesium-translocating P-type ATPase [Ktedonobacteraceae bacterium]
MNRVLTQQPTTEVNMPTTTLLAEDALRLPLPELYARLQTTEEGLSSQEARRRLKTMGANEPANTTHVAAAIQFWRLFLSPLVIILLIASLVTAILGDVLNASIIALIVLLGITLNFIQTYRSQQAVERLRAGVAPMATVRRDGTWQELPRRELVPGDVIQLIAGDLVPSDARLIQTVDLHVQQAALTGESLPVAKSADVEEDDQQAIAEVQNGVFLGTSVVSGTATAVITATGRRTAFGDIVEHLRHRPPETDFERGIRHFAFLILQTVFGLVLFVFLVGVLFHHNLFESVLFAIALAVGLTPEFLPMITTVTLGQGASRMARQKVIVKHLESMQNFGSMDILCSDKTGTLTGGAMEVDQALDLAGQPSERVFLLAYLNSSYETGIHSPLDEAILQHQHLDISAYQKQAELPFDFERRRLSVIIREEGNCHLIAKGAPESVLAVCEQYEVDGMPHPLLAEDRERAVQLYQRLSAQGFRILAVASRSIDEQQTYHLADEQHLVLAGFVTFADPPLPDAADAIQALARDGVQIKILTGDNELVTHHVCSLVSLPADSMVLGKDLERMSDAALGHIVEQTHVFARVSPAQKNRIILALKHRHHVVGFLGDGINDAPSLHAADVGISVTTATDVARDAADIVLLERGLRVLHQGILEGRKAFGNVIKYLLMGTSSNFGNMFSMAGAFLFLPFLPMLPTQILLNNFLYDLAQVTIPTDQVDASFIQKPQHWNIRLIRHFMLFIGPLSSIYDFLTFFLMLAVFHANAPLFHTGWFVESLATQTLVLFVIRTAGNPFRSRPSKPLALTTCLVVALGLLLPFTPLAASLGFVPLPALFFLLLAAMTVTYLLLVELVKRRVMKRSERSQET